MTIRPGDRVLHHPSGETLRVCYFDQAAGLLGVFEMRTHVEASAVDLVERASEEEFLAALVDAEKADLFKGEETRRLYPVELAIANLRDALNSGYQAKGVAVWTRDLSTILAALEAERAKAAEATRLARQATATADALLSVVECCRPRTLEDVVPHIAEPTDPHVVDVAAKFGGGADGLEAVMRSAARLWFVLDPRRARTVGPSAATVAAAIKAARP